MRLRAKLRVGLPEADSADGLDFDGRRQDHEAGDQRPVPLVAEGVRTKSHPSWMTARVAFLRRSSQDNAEKHGEKARAGYQRAFREGGFEVQRRSADRTGDNLHMTRVAQRDGNNNLPVPGNRQPCSGIDLPHSLYSRLHGLKPPISAATAQANWKRTPLRH